MSLKEKFTGPATSIDDQIESFATDRVPADQRWPIPAISIVLLGNATAMFFFSFGAQQAFMVGWPKMLIPIGYFFFGAIIIGALTMRMASGEGLSQGLISRGLGFGSRGAAVTSFIYAVNFIFYFLYEGSLVTHAIAEYFHIPINSVRGTLIFAMIGMVAIGIVWRGMTAMSWLQSWGFPIFVVLLTVALIKLQSFPGAAPVGPHGWVATASTAGSGLLAAMSFANGQMIFQGLMATDYGRFASKTIRYRGTATIMILELVPMFTVIFLGAYLGSSLAGKIGAGNAMDPGIVFAQLMGLLGVIFVVITQIRINVMNLYGGSITLAAGFDVIAHLRPGRPWWMFLVWAFGVIFYATNVVTHLATFLSVAGVLTNTWVLVLLADYFICRRMLKLGVTENIEFKEGHVRAWNPCGLASLGISVVVGGVLIAMGGNAASVASFVAMILGPILHVIFTVSTKGKFYTPAETSPRVATGVPA